MALTLGIDVACRAAHQATLAVEGKTVWRGRKFWTRSAELERLWDDLELAASHPGGDPRVEYVRAEQVGEQGGEGGFVAGFAGAFGLLLELHRQVGGDSDGDAPDGHGRGLAARCLLGAGALVPEGVPGLVLLLCGGLGRRHVRPPPRCWTGRSW